MFMSKKVGINVRDPHVDESGKMTFTTEPYKPNDEYYVDIPEVGRKGASMPVLLIEEQVKTTTDYYIPAVIYTFRRFEGKEIYSLWVEYSEDGTCTLFDITRYIRKGGPTENYGDSDVTALPQCIMYIDYLYVNLGLRRIHLDAELTADDMLLRGEKWKYNFKTNDPYEEILSVIGFVKNKSKCTKYVMDYKKEEP